jgi:hypothetical protein
MKWNRQECRMLGIILTLVAVLIALSFAFYTDYAGEKRAGRE